MAEPLELEEAKPRAAEEPRPRRWLWPVMGLVLALAAAAGYLVWTRLSAREATDDAQIDGHISPIGPRVGGTVVAVNVDDNQLVEAGTVLFQIDPTDFKVAVEQARADLAEARADAQGARASVPVTSTSAGSNISTATAGIHEAEAGVAVAEKNVSTAQARLRSAQARLREAEANFTKAGRDLERYKQLVGKDEISQQQYDAAVATADAAKATVESNQAAVAEAEQAIAGVRSQVEQARAQVARAEAAVRAASSAPQQIEVTRSQAQSAAARVQQKKAALDQAQLDLQYTTVRSPVAGVAGNKTVQVGQLTQKGQMALAIVPLNDVWVTANFKETQLKNIRAGQRATVTVDALGGREYRGHVDTLAPATGARFSILPPENATGNYVKVVQRIPVKIVLDEPNTGGLLRPGMSVDAKVWIR